MYDIRQFRPTLYVLVFLGFTGFAVAAESPGIWLMSVGALALNAWLVSTNRFTPLPRWLANLVTVLSLLYVADKVMEAPQAPILVIGQFLVLLQVVKIWEQRANRDYAQLLVLSLLLVVASSISTASLIFGLMLIAYLFLSLYCCLLFHLKVEAEQARDAVTDSAGVQPNPVTLRQDQRMLPSSMRRLTGLVAVSAVTSAVVVFLFFPRGTGGNLIGPMRFKPSQTLTGFSDQVSFEQVARITQSNDEVARVIVEHNGQLVDGNELLMLRGITLDVYGGAGDGSTGAWRWTRSARQDPAPINLLGHSRQDLPAPPGSGDVWKQTIHLNPTGTKVLFAMAGVESFTPGREVNVLYAPSDQVLMSREPLFQPLEYVVTSHGVLAREDFDSSNAEDRRRLSRLLDAVRRAVGDQAAKREEQRRQTDDGEPLAQSVIDPKIRQYAVRPEVCGTDRASGKSLAELRGDVRGPTPLDGEIAANISRHLQTTFSYTLDLTDAAHIIKGEDPLVAFLYDLKRGHCEYFAGAMTLMCQSLGMDARLVVGFKCDDFNTLGHYYQVNQSHAHAWVEVLMPDGTWRTYDPTSSQDARVNRQTTMLSRLKHFFNFLEFKWAEHVVAYDNDTRANLIEHVETGMTSTATKTSDRVGAFRQWITDAATVLSISSQVLAGLVVLAVLAGVAAVGYFLFERWLLRRRAARIGLEGLPEADQLRLARQLKFYADLMRVLGRRGVERPRYMTPLEFAETLTFLPTDVYDGVHALTRSFYEVRFGRHELPAEEHRRLTQLVTELDQRLPPVGALT